MGLLLHSYDQLGPAQLIANAASQGAARQQQNTELLAKLASEMAHNRQLAIENQRRLDFDKAKLAEGAREFNVEQAPYVPPTLPTGGGPTSAAGATLQGGSPGLDVSDVPAGELTGGGEQGVNLYNVGGPQPLSAPLIPQSDTSGFMPGDAAPADAPSGELAPSPMQLQPPDLAAASADQTGGTGSAFGPVNPFEPPQFDAPPDLQGGEAVPNQALADARQSQFNAAKQVPMTPPELPAKALDGVKEDVAKVGELFRGMPSKYAVPAIAHFAQQRVLQAAHDASRTASEKVKTTYLDQSTGQMHTQFTDGKWDNLPADFSKLRKLDANPPRSVVKSFVDANTGAVYHQKENGTLTDETGAPANFPDDMSKFERLGSKTAERQQLAQDREKRLAGEGDAKLGLAQDRLTLAQQKAQTDADQKTAALNAKSDAEKTKALQAERVNLRTFMGKRASLAKDSSGALLGDAKDNATALDAEITAAKQRIAAMGGNPDAPTNDAGDELVAVVSPDGVSGKVPRTKLDALLKLGYKAP